MNHTTCLARDALSRDERQRERRELAAGDVRCAVCSQATIARSNGTPTQHYINQRLCSGGNTVAAAAQREVA